ncbi:hypothetical protein HRI_000009700 [Hibiscus trionum]|uniref:Uncharacterized protein n=1 Tax=Hibiscus trionum TaxID=183268 RepID=A0A9W7GR59_HIBTR|nr:hypothetical protein HRI_000009700 [Hibiscus trionum]
MEPRPEWQLETNRLRVDLNGVKERLEQSLDNKMKGMKASLMADLQKLLEIALGKRSFDEENNNRQASVLGAPPELQTSKLGMGINGGKIKHLMSRTLPTNP